MSDSENKSGMNLSIESGLKKAGEGIADRAITAIGNFVKNRYGEAQVMLGTAFIRYLENATKRYNQIRTLATGLEPRPIIGNNNIYVQSKLKYRNSIIDTVTVDNMLSISTNLIILGTGGIGESMLMRYLFLTTAHSGKYIPVLLDLRKISNQAKGSVSIFELIHSCMQEFDVELPKEQFVYSLRLGKYLFLFDGLDEIKEDYIPEAIDKLQGFSAKYSKNPCIITSRPRQNISALETYTIVDSMPLSKGQQFC